MRILILYVPIVLAVIMPLLFRRAYGVRVLSVVILCSVASLHFTFLMTEHRLIMQAGRRELAVPRGSQLPPDFDLAVTSVQKHSQQQMWPFAALVSALVILSLFPFGITKSRTSDNET